MIRFIAALDSKMGIADDGGIPWQGKIPTDVAYFRSKTINSTVLMGAGWYKEQQLPLPERRNVVATSSQEPLRGGFELTNDARKFLQDAKEDIWVGGGAALFTSTLDLAEELYLTRLWGDYNCTKFFPDFEHTFERVQRSENHTENGITYCFEIWKKKG